MTDEANKPKISQGRRGQNRSCKWRNLGGIRGRLVSHSNGKPLQNLHMFGSSDLNRASGGTAPLSLSSSSATATEIMLRRRSSRAACFWPPSRRTASCLVP
jgi:hypothetical protein